MEQEFKNKKAMLKILGEKKMEILFCGLESEKLI